MNQVFRSAAPGCAPIAAVRGIDAVGGSTVARRRLLLVSGGYALIGIGHSKLNTVIGVFCRR